MFWFIAASRFWHGECTLPDLTAFSRRFSQALVVLAICLVSAEAALRLQQAIGPLYDLEARDANLDWYSDTLNHRAEPHKTLQFIGPSMYGAQAGFTYTMTYDEQGIRQPVTRATGEGCARQVSLLFLGDSFMMGYDDAHTVPNRVAEDLLRDRRICSTAYNAGQTSYSPAIFIPFARKLVPAIRPDYVVIDIDETDLVDDVYRYEPLVVHDAQGGVDHVKVSPPLYALHAGLIEMRRHWFYLQRLIDKFWLTQVTVPRLLRERPVPDAFLASHDRGPDLEARHAHELAIFERNFNQLIEVIQPSMASVDRIIFINHPHLEHLQSDARGPIFNDLIRRTVQKVAMAHGAAFFDATPELTRRFAGRPQDFYWNGDMHFTFTGLDLYAEAVAGFLAGRLR